jgi:hypothetical protein
MKTKKTTYSIFRYQLLPNTTMPITLFDVIRTKDELVESKNNFFKDVVIDAKVTYKGKGRKVLGKIEYNNGNDILLKIGVEKSKEIHKSDFNKETIMDYPNINIYINNDKDNQFLVIERNLDAFSDTVTVANILKESWNRRLKEYRLDLYIKQTFDDNQFWDTIKLYQDRITALKFELIKPNISNISGKIKEVFGVIGNDLNGHTIDLNLIAPSNSTLENLTPGNEVVESILSYNKEGGGEPPTIRVKGFSKSIKTIDSERSIEIDEYNGSIEGLIALLKSKLG